MPPAPLFLATSPPGVLPPGLYGMADAAWGDPVPMALALVEGCCRTIQLRAKGVPLSTLAAQARALLPPLRARGVRLLINDHVSVALEVGADGVHLGQDDGDPAQARAQLGPAALIGLSTHTLAQVRAACPPLVDYIGFGPVFPTTTKDTGYAPRGLDLLRLAVQQSHAPVVAIGGINRSRLSEVRATGARHWAVIGDILGQPDVASAARNFQVFESPEDAGVSGSRL